MTHRSNITDFNDCAFNFYYFT